MCHLWVKAISAISAKQQHLAQFSACNKKPKPLPAWANPVSCKEFRAHISIWLIQLRNSDTASTSVLSLCLPSFFQSVGYMSRVVGLSIACKNDYVTFVTFQPLFLLYFSCATVDKPDKESALIIEDC